MSRFFFLLVKLTLVFSVLAGCSLPPRLTGKPGWFAELEKRHGRLMPGQIVELQSGRLVRIEELLDQLDGRRIVYVGETHNAMDHHDVQLEILENLYARDPRLVIGMEMFERTFQGVLDRWTSGTIDRETLLRESEWYSRWKFDFFYYERILNFARQNQIKVLALNAPRELVEKVGDFGIKALSLREKTMIASIDKSDARHREYVREVFKTHQKTPGKTFENFYEAQCVWDDTMAETISDFMTSKAGEGKRVIVFSGAGHIVYKFGIPERAHGRTNLPYATVLPSSLKQIRGRSHEDERLPHTAIADFLWITEDLVREKVRLGVIAENSLAHEKGVVIRRVTKGSSAEKAGIQPGDTILSIDGARIDDMVDLRLVLADKEPGSTSQVVFRRGDQKEEAVVSFLKKSLH